jgi:hypothetical protein
MGRAPDSGGMSSVQRLGDLEIDQDLTFQQREWIGERIGWAVLVLIILAASLGLLGAGPFSRATAEAPGRLRVEYARFARYQTAETLTIRVESAATATAEVRVAIDRAYLEGSRVESVVPVPLRVDSAAERLVYVFGVTRRGEPLAITFRLEPERLGVSRGHVSLEPARAADPAVEIAFRQLVYP